jgi:hypothetical protein
VCQTDFQINGKSSGSFDRRCLDLNASYDEFLSRINTVAAAKKKLRIDVIQAARSTIRYYWLAGNKVHALPKNLGNPDFLEDEENYVGLQNAIRGTMSKKPDLDNHFLRLMVDYTLDPVIAGVYDKVDQNNSQNNGTRLVNLI